MAILNQFRKVTGRRFRNPYLDEINAKVPFLAQKAAAQQRLRDEAARRERQEKEIELAEDRAKEAKDNQKIANIVGGINTGLNLVTGAYNAFSGGNEGNAIQQPKTEPMKETVKEEPVQDYGVDINQYMNSGSSGDQNYDLGTDIWNMPLDSLWD